MADVPQIDIVNGVPTTGTGTVKTLSVVADALATLQTALQTALELSALEAGGNLAAIAASVNGVAADNSVTAAGAAIVDNGLILTDIDADIAALRAIHEGWDADTAASAVAGDVAHDAADAGNPLSAGFQARTTNPTPVAGGDRVKGIADSLGKQVVVGSLRAMKVRQTTALTASTAETTILTAAASTFCDLYGLIITNTSATAVASVTIRDTTAGSAVAFFAVPAGETRGFMLPESGAIPQTTVNTNWTAQSGTSVSSLQITALAVKNL